MTGVAGTPEDVDYVAEIERLAGEFARIVRGADLDSAVAACPGWTAYDLASHLGVVHRWAAGIVTTGDRVSVDVADPRRTSEAVAEWYAEGADELIGALVAADLSDPCWNFAGVRPTKRFWARRQTHELHVHLMDLCLAVGAALPEVTPEVSADGIGEVLDTFMPRLALRDVYPNLQASLAVVAADAEVAWILQPGPSAASGACGRLPVLDGPLEIGSPAGLPPDQIRGAAQTLLSVLWKRAPASDVETRGERARVAIYLASELTS